MAMTVYEKTMQRALRLLAYRARTVAEMRERLREKEWADSESVEAVVARLIELGYLNDTEYADNFAASRLRARPLGRTRLRMALQRRQLPPETVDRALADAYAEIPEEQLIETAIGKYTRLRGLPQTLPEKKRLSDWLLRRGFSPDLVRRHVQ